MNSQSTEQYIAHLESELVRMRNLYSQERADSLQRESSYRALPTPRSEFRANVKAPMADYLRADDRKPAQPKIDLPLVTMFFSSLAGLALWALFGWAVVACIKWVIA